MTSAPDDAAVVDDERRRRRPDTLIDDDGNCVARSRFMLDDLGGPRSNRRCKRSSPRPTPPTARSNRFSPTVSPPALARQPCFGCRPGRSTSVNPEGRASYPSTRPSGRNAIGETGKRIFNLATARAMRWSSRRRIEIPADQLRGIALANMRKRPAPSKCWMTSGGGSAVPTCCCCRRRSPFKDCRSLISAITGGPLGTVQVITYTSRTLFENTVRSSRTS